MGCYLVRRLINGDDGWYGAGWNDTEELVRDLLTGEYTHVVSVLELELDAPIPEYNWGQTVPEQTSVCLRRDVTVAVMRQMVRIALEEQIPIPRSLDPLVEALV